MNDCSEQIQQQVIAARRQHTPMRIVGGDSKSFYGKYKDETVLGTAEHHGIINYDPTELVITAHSGTSLSSIETTLAEHGQMLAFEPPHFETDPDAGATLGGAIATGLSGPARPFKGAARDFVLGTTLINGKAERLHFGGEVMKNVAGYDVSRLMTGAMGTLGVLLDISVKVLPTPQQDVTISQQLGPQRALDDMLRYCNMPVPLSAACYDGSQLHLRLSGNEAAIKDAQASIGGEFTESSGAYWQALRDHKHPFFNTDLPLWRLSLAAATPLDDLFTDIPGEVMLDWAGAQRWLKSDAPADKIRAAVSRAAGHATLFRCHAAENMTERFQPMPGPLMALHSRLKNAFDPDHLFNPGRLYRFV